MNAQRYVVDIMTPNPVVIGSVTTAWAAECLAEERNVHHLIVIDHYELVGEVCRCDLRAAKAGAIVQSCMKTPPITIDDQRTAVDAMGVMAQCAVGCLPVVDWSGALHGVLTRRDLRNAGILTPPMVRVCVACGSTHGVLPAPGDGEVMFCARCLDHVRAPRAACEEFYVAEGGGD
jgi:signal-transduction protein with cAMP-binding, CBS, and nucleotidyltransferase domain